MENHADNGVEEKKEKNDWKKELLGYIVWLAGVFIAVQLFIHFVGVFSIVDGNSMLPTLYDGEFLWIDKLSYHISDPERFDVVVFPVEEGGTTQYFIKRIIALPGETIYIDEGGNIYIDGELLEEPYGREVIAVYNRQRAAEPLTMGEDEYFVMGDNRNHSSDSRFDVVGNVHLSEFIGKAAFRFWPLSKIGIIK